MSLSDITQKSILQQRERILQYTLWATALLSTIAYIPSVMIAWDLQLISLIVVDSLAWLAVVVLALWRTLPFQIKAVTFLVCWTVFSLYLLWLVGPVGASVAWLLIAPVLATLFFGYRGAIFASVTMVVLVIIYGVLLRLHSPESPLFPSQPYDTQSWYGVSGTLIFLATFSSLAIAQLLKGLESTLVDLEASRQHLAQALHDREQLQEQLLHSQKLSALGTLTSGIAHDFNNLLLPVLMASEEARELAPPGSLQKQYLDTVILSAERARNLVRRILGVGQNASVAPHAMKIAPVLLEGVALLRSSAPANIDIGCDISADDACIMADPDSLNQIIMNLGTNACLAMKETGGTLSFRLHRVDASGQVLLEVEDTGTGIPVEIHHRIFDPFFTTRAPGSGTGLGLSIVHRLVTAMGGTIRFHSTPGVGTCFILTFDEVIASADAVEQRQETVAEPPVNKSRLRVLIVDDDDMVRSTLRNTLVREGYEVMDTGSPVFALQQLAEKSATIDLVVTDFAMPVMNGLQLAEKIRALHPGLPIVLATGYLSGEHQERCNQIGINAILAKPFNRASILQQLQDL